MNRPPFKLGYTLTTSCLPCPFKYQQTNGKPRGSNDSEEATIGTLLHVLGMWNDQHLVVRRGKPGQAGRSQDIEVLRIFRDRILQEADINPQGNMGRFYLALAKQYETYKLPQGNGQWLFEQRMEVDRNWQPCAVNDEFDGVQGTGDRIFISADGLSGSVLDRKFGHFPVSYDTAKDSIQLKTYVWLTMLHHPSIRVMAGTLDSYTLHGCGDSTADFHREPLCSEMEAWYGGKFAELEAEYALKGSKPWRAYGHWSCCRFCTLRCPRLSEITGGQINAS